MPEPVSKSQYVLNLARELLDDIELSRLPAEALLLKAMRLARLVGSEEIQKWLEFEMIGYSDDPILLKYGRVTGRLTDPQKKLGYWGPLAEIDASLATLRLRLQGLRVPDVSYSVSSANPNEWVTSPFTKGTEATAPVNAVIAEAKSLSDEIQRKASIRSKVLAVLHTFVSNVYHERVFSGLAESIFERYKATVDSSLVSRAGDVLQRVPSVYDRLAEGDQEAISQALTTCRRIIDAFADAVYPPSDTPIQVEGQAVQVGPQHHLNRINAYIRQRVTSDSRRTRLRQSFGNLYGRVSSGVHSDVTPDEARALFLETYLLLGEVLTLAEPPPVPPLVLQPSPPSSESIGEAPRVTEVLRGGSDDGTRSVTKPGDRRGAIDSS